jgi:hypothetical protein
MLDVKTKNASQKAWAKRAASLLILLDLIFVYVLEWNRDPIVFRRPVAEIDDATSLRTERAIRIIFPLSSLTAYRALHNLTPHLPSFNNDTMKRGEYASGD